MQSQANSNSGTTSSPDSPALCDRRYCCPHPDGAPAEPALLLTLAPRGHRCVLTAPSPKGWPLTCLCNASFLGPRVLLRFLRSRDDASERFFLQTCPVVSGLQLCLRGTFERLGVPGDVRKGLSASWSHLCPHLPWTRRQSHVLTRAGGDGTLQQVGPLLGTPHGPPVPAPLFL